jgi:hypothetical protein
VTRLSRDNIARSIRGDDSGERRDVLHLPTLLKKAMYQQVVRRPLDICSPSFGLAVEAGLSSAGANAGADSRFPLSKACGILF